MNNVNKEQIAKEKKEKLKKKKSKNLTYEQNEEEIFNYSQQYEEVKQRRIMKRKCLGRDFINYALE